MEPKFLPTPEQIAERARQVREEGYVNERGEVREPWDAAKYGVEPEVKIQIVKEGDLMPEPTWDPMKGL